MTFLVLLRFVSKEYSSEFFKSIVIVNDNNLKILKVSKCHFLHKGNYYARYYGRQRIICRSWHGEQKSSGRLYFHKNKKLIKNSKQVWNHTDEIAKPKPLEDGVADVELKKWEYECENLKKWSRMIFIIKWWSGLFTLPLIYFVLLFIFAYFKVITNTITIVNLFA